MEALKLVHYAPKSSYETPLFATLDAINALRRDGESAFDAAERLLVNEALHRTKGQQKGAAKLLGVTRRVLNHRAANLRVRPMDKPKGAA